MAKNVLAFDLGASSGRAMMGAYQDGKLTLEEAHRFDNRAIMIGSRYLWDAPGLFGQMCDGLAAAAKIGKLDSMGIDTWGVDYALLDRNDQLIGNPVSYRDARTDHMMEAAFAIMPKEAIAEKTGLAFMQFNTLYQLLAMKKERDPQLDIAKSLLLLPDFLMWLFSGEKGAEYTHASTTQLADPRTRSWSRDILEAFDIPADILQNMQEPGAVRGKLRESLRKELLVDDMPMIAVGSHDTASAVAAVPARGSFAYISSGTWSLVGLETPSPIINPIQVKYNLTNEGGVFGTTRVLKNVMGLWIIQECRRSWLREGYTFSFAEICALAEKEAPFLAVINPDDESFFAPNEMPEKVQAYCKRTGQRVPETPAQIARVVFESLALCYRSTINHLREASGQTIEALHIVGGGANNGLLNSFTASALGMPVYAGPGEATALGNCLMQLYALGELSDLAQMRAVVRASYPPEEVLPKATAAWEEKLAQAIENSWIQ